ncbi:MAG: TonB-dependent receptor [Gemmatimonadota bacterium]|nr:TonB-dependent receptor [Gemmatimonadota bacterium]
MTRTITHGVLAFTLWAAAPAAAQTREGTHPVPDSAATFLLDGLNVTAVRSLRSTYSTPAPVSVIDVRTLRRVAPANASDLFLRVPGMDAEGVGPAQRRPVIRGMRGQRVLLLEDGLRLNNVRRRVDSGEPTGLVWTSSVERVEVVRGPASVLYGSDALGGVVNLVTRPAPAGVSGAHGFFEAGRRSEGEAYTLSGEIASTTGPLGLRIAGGFRDTGSYRAPAGTFGTLTLNDGAEVFDSGVRDGSLRVEARYTTGPRSSVFVRHEAYRSTDSGYGWIAPENFGPDEAKTRLVWPDQDFARTTFGVQGSGLDLRFADDLEASAYFQGNQRRFLTEVYVPASTVPGAYTEVISDNFTDLGSSGLRIELRKLVHRDVLITYGVDAYRDRSEGTDTTTTTVFGFGPTVVVGRGGPQVPDARVRNLGVFAQSQWMARPGTEIVAGVRYQDVTAKSLATEGNDATPRSYDDRNLVGSLNLLHDLGDSFKLLASVGRGFRTPNLVERFFTGYTGGNRGFWEANPDLRPEVGLNLEVGARARGERFRAEVFLFRNTLSDGIVLEPTGQTLGRTVFYRNVNVDELRYQGVELGAEVALTRAFTLDGSWTVLATEDRRDPTRVLADSYPDKVLGSLRFDEPSGRGWAAYSVRRSGSRATIAGTTPVGDTIPGFTVHEVRAGMRVAGRHHVGVAVENLTDALYAEALNTGFFRPEPGRSFAVSWRVEF